MRSEQELRDVVKRMKDEKYEWVRAAERWRTTRPSFDPETEGHIAEAFERQMDLLDDSYEHVIETIEWVLDDQPVRLEDVGDEYLLGATNVDDFIQALRADAESREDGSRGSSG